MDSFHMDTVIAEGTYRKQLRNSIADLVAEYLTDDDLTPQDFMDDILGEVKEWTDYHETQLQKCYQIYLKLNGLAK